MKKATLSPNPVLQAKQRLIIDRLPESDRVITRDTIAMEIGSVDRPDKTKVPIGRVNPGEFNVTLDFADDAARDAYYNWFLECIDNGGRGDTPGINPTYKRNAVIKYDRLYRTTERSGQPISLRLIGCFPTSCTMPDFDMNGEDTSNLEMTISYDDVRLIDAAPPTQAVA